MHFARCVMKRTRRKEEEKKVQWLSCALRSTCDAIEGPHRHIPDIPVVRALGSMHQMLVGTKKQKVVQITTLSNWTMIHAIPNVWWNYDWSIQPKIRISRALGIVKNGLFRVSMTSIFLSDSKMLLFYKYIQEKETGGCMQCAHRGCFSSSRYPFWRETKRFYYTCQRSKIWNSHVVYFSAQIKWCVFFGIQYSFVITHILS